MANNLSNTSRAMFEWYYPFGALVAFVLFFTFLGVVWVGYMIYMSRCKSRGSQSRQPSIYKGNDGGDAAAGTANNEKKTSETKTETKEDDKDKAKDKEENVKVDDEDESEEDEVKEKEESTLTSEDKKSTLTPSLVSSKSPSADKEQTEQQTDEKSRDNSATPKQDSLTVPQNASTTGDKSGSEYKSLKEVTEPGETTSEKQQLESPDKDDGATISDTSSPAQIQENNSSQDLPQTQTDKDTDNVKA